MDTNKIKEIIDIFEGSKVAVMELEIEGMSIRLEKQTASAQNFPNIVIPQQETTPSVDNIKSIEEVIDYDEVKSPLVGTFYCAPSEDSEPFVRVGSTVKKGDTLCIIEAMKVMNEIKASRDGIIKKILIDNGEMVQFDQVMMHIGD
ncbi:MAG: acetyl-CoA carboxylase biotin carboxyl carrier protein [Tissierellia bacterium]|nr:acetyl-CoA carboxylase biotin carboxyl carrier protein [Tissierellia bacterium]